MRIASEVFTSSMHMKARVREVTNITSSEKNIAAKDQKVSSTGGDWQCNHVFKRKGVTGRPATP
jgi:hypothetical protein